MLSIHFDPSLFRPTLSCEMLPKPWRSFSTICSVRAPLSLQRAPGHVLFKNKNGGTIYRDNATSQYIFALSSICKLNKSISQQNNQSAKNIYKLIHPKRNYIYTKKRERSAFIYCGDDDPLLNSFLGYKITCWFNGKENALINSEEIRLGILTQGIKFMFPLYKIPPSFANINLRECNGNGLLFCPET